MDIREELNNLVQHSFETPPPVLYHYTDANGLIGIIKEGKVWATKSNYLNDPVEIKYGLEMVGDVAEELAKTENDKEIVRFLNNLSRNILDGILSYKEGHYIASFSQDGDLLSHWKMYAKDGNGYSIGINVGDGFVNPFYILPVVYDGDSQKRIINKILLKCIEYYKENGFGIIASNSMYSSLVDTLKMIVACFKQTAYKSENEWRVVFSPKGNDDICFRSGRGESVVPYIPVNLMGNDGSLEKLPISTIIVGPQQDEEFESIRLLMKRYGYMTIPINKSEIRYRS